MKRISVVIPTYNSGHVLGGTLERLARQDYPRDKFEVVVLDDGSTDDTRQVVERWAPDLPVRYVYQPNAGRAAARNAGARTARHDVILFLDADIWAEPDLLRQHAGHYDDGDRVGVQGPSRTHPASLVNPFMQVKELFPDLTPRRRNDLSPYHVISNFSVRAEDLWAVGGFDESFTGYGWEDIELWLRLRRHGVRLRWEPAAVAWHHHIEDLPTARRKQVESGSGAVYFWRKHGSPFGLGMFLELHPVIRPLKWIVYRSGLFTPPIRAVLRTAERRLDQRVTGWRRRLWLLVASECYNHLLWDAYYEGVWRALSQRSETGDRTLDVGCRMSDVGCRHTPDGQPEHGPKITGCKMSDVGILSTLDCRLSPVDHRPRILIVSNGYGEDAMGTALARELIARGATVAAYPLVGTGHSYLSSGIPMLDPRRNLPAAGFGFRTGARESWRELRAGWIRLAGAQRTTLRAARGTFDRIVAIGDAFCLWMAASADPGGVVYVPTAKSEYNEPHHPFEITLIRRLAEVSFPRDEATARRFAAAGLRAEYVGNLMMDCLQFTGEDFGLPAYRPVVLLLPGSRADAAHNLRLLLEAASRIGGTRNDVAFVCALSPIVDAPTLAVEAGANLAGNEIRVPYPLPVTRDPPDLRVQLTRNFADAASRATVVLGMAGTASEQTAGLGKPVVAFPGPGPQFTRKFLVLQAKLLGEAVLPVEGPAEAAAAVLRLLDDPVERARRGAVGRDRMGAPGATQRIAGHLLDGWHKSRSGGTATQRP